VLSRDLSNHPDEPSPIKRKVPLKVAFLLETFPKLSETFILNQITGMIDRGCEVDIFAKWTEEIDKKHPDIEKYTLLDRTFYVENINKILPDNKLKRLLNGMNLIGGNITKRPKAIFKSLNLGKLGVHALTLRPLHRVVRYLDKGPYDIIHCHVGYMGHIGMYLRDIGALDGKMVTTFYGFDVSGYVKKNGHGVYASMFKRGDLFLTLSEDMKGRLIDLGCPGEKIKIHRLGIDMDRFGCQARVVAKDRTIRLLSVGRLVEKKGFPYSIRAVANVVRQHSRIEYTIIGDGILRNDIESLIRELNVEPFVSLRGWQTPAEVEKAMAESDIFISPSVTGTDGDQEGTPTVLIEASARCLPIVSTHHAGIAEVVRHGVSGFLVPEKDVDAMTDKIRYLVENPEKRIEFGRAGRRHVKTFHDIRMLNDRLLETYHSVVRKRDF
jgi:colanic acid/amylovoran biosynthesis glycosyltransferase